MSATASTTSSSTLYISQQNLQIMLAQQLANHQQQAAANYGHPPTPEQLAERREEEARRQAAQAERVRKNEEVRAKARGLLLKHLTPEQQETYEKNKWFVVEGGRSKKKYQLHPAVAGNVLEMSEDNKRSIYRYCCHCDHSIPLEDNLLAQKLMLEAHEDEFLRLANRTAA